MFQAPLGSSRNKIPKSWIVSRGVTAADGWQSFPASWRPLFSLASGTEWQAAVGMWLDSQPHAASERKPCFHSFPPNWDELISALVQPVGSVRGVVIEFQPRLWLLSPALRYRLLEILTLRRHRIPLAARQKLLLCIREAAGSGGKWAEDALCLPVFADCEGEHDRVWVLPRSGRHFDGGLCEMAFQKSAMILEGDDLLLDDEKSLCGEEKDLYVGNALSTEHSDSEIVDRPTSAAGATGSTSPCHSVVNDPSMMGSSGDRDVECIKDGRFVETMTLPLASKVLPVTAEKMTGRLTSLRRKHSMDDNEVSAPHSKREKIAPSSKHPPALLEQTIESLETNLTSLDEGLRVRIYQLQEDIHSVDEPLPALDIAVLAELTFAQMESVCQHLDLPSLSLAAVSAICQQLVRLCEELSFNNAALFLRCCLANKIGCSSQPVPRSLLVHLVSLLTRYSHPLLHGVFLPLLKNKSEFIQVEVLRWFVREPQSCSFCHDLLELFLEVSLSTGVWSEEQILFLQSVLDSKVVFDEPAAGLFVKCVKQQATDQCKNVKFSKMILTALQRHHVQLLPYVAEFTAITSSNSTVLKKAIQAAVRRL